MTIFETELTAKTVSEAYKKAIAVYSSMGEIAYEVISHGKPGFLGIFGRQEAVIKVTVDDGKGISVRKRKSLNSYDNKE